MGKPAVKPIWSIDTRQFLLTAKTVPQFESSTFIQTIKVQSEGKGRESPLTHDKDRSLPRLGDGRGGGSRTCPSAVAIDSGSAPNDWPSSSKKRPSRTRPKSVDRDAIERGWSLLPANHEPLGASGLWGRSASPRTL